MQTVSSPHVLLLLLLLHLPCACLLQLLLLTPLAVLVSFAAKLLANMVWQATARLSAIRLLASYSWKHTCSQHAAQRTPANKQLVHAAGGDWLQRKGCQHYRTSH
jgi:hypothetical protein